MGSWMHTIISSVHVRSSNHQLSLIPSRTRAAINTRRIDAFRGPGPGSRYALSAILPAAWSGLETDGNSGMHPGRKYDFLSSLAPTFPVRLSVHISMLQLAEAYFQVHSVLLLLQIRRQTVL